MRKWLMRAYLLILLICTTLCGCGGGSSSQTASHGSEYAQPIRNYGESWTDNVISMQQSGASFSANDKTIVNAVFPDGSFSEDIYSGNVQVSDSYLFGPNHGALRYTNEAGASCLYTPNGVTLPFPLWVGKTWTSQYTSNCHDKLPVAYSVSGKILAEETIATALGNLDTLQYSFTVTQADGAEQTTQQCNWSIQFGVNVRCVITHEFVPPPSASTVISETSTIGSFFIGSEVSPAATSSVYPAFPSDTLPLATASQASAVLAAPRIIPVFLNDASSSYQSTRATAPGFMARYLGSPYWAQLQQYGVGVATVQAAVTVAAPLTVSVPADVTNWLRTQIVANPGAMGSPAADSVLVLYLPAAQSSSLCAHDLGYHSYLVLPDGITRLPFAVILDCSLGLEQMTAVSSHELAEAATDPFLSAYNNANTATIWKNIWGSEIADWCEMQTMNGWLTPAAIGHRIALFWSNAALAQAGNPCAPQGSDVSLPTPYMQAAPQTPDSVELGFSENSGVTDVYLPGVKVDPISGSGTLAIRLSSATAVPGVWHLRASQYVGVGSPILGYAWDEDHGNNGDVVHLTVTLKSGDLSNGAVVAIDSFYAGLRRRWLVPVSTVSQ